MARVDHWHRVSPAQVSAYGLKGDLHLPVAQKPGHDRGWWVLRIGAEQGRDRLNTGRIPQQHPHRGTVDWPGRMWRALPIAHSKDRHRPLYQRTRNAAHTVSGSASCQCSEASRPWARRSCPRSATASRPEVPAAAGPVPDNQFPVGQPAAQDAQPRTGPVQHRLVTAAPGLVIAPGRGPHGQKGQDPHPAGPGSLGQQ